MKNYIEDFIKEVQVDGKLYFTLDEVRKRFNANYKSALKFSLNRLVNKTKILSVYKGFYVIIPPEYSRLKILPPELFIDALFKYLNRPYYVGLLSAAFYHGASHQQPQEYFVLIDKPAMRSTQEEGLKINYVVKSNLGKSKIENKKNSAGYIKISTPEQTAVDLICFQNRIGGLNRAATIIYELTETMEVKRFKDVLPNCRSNAALQRLGYILENVVGNNNLAEIVGNFLSNKKLFRVPLKSSASKEGVAVNPKWKVIENFKIDTDF
ncbi:MAG TPA: hypothetical protein ENI57_07130 [Ignavibacteria bacterium]|nr:hypothetical protein [Ignavibacteria bacterium]